MADRALVIGIDHYVREDWGLRAAVRDARAFANWVTEPGAGRATPETLRMLLSPRPDAEHDGSSSYERATRAALEDALDELVFGDFGDAERLWFFYAGHALAQPGQPAGTPPVLLPDDVDDIERYLWRTKGLGDVLAPLQHKGPRTQFFFIDACRGLAQLTEAFATSTQLFFDLAKVPGSDKAKARQAVLCATTTGQLANEVGAHGLFGKALLEGLRANGPELDPDPRELDLVLTFDSLVEFTRRRVRELGQAASRPGAALPTQDPWPSLLGMSGSEPVVRFDPDAQPTAQLRVAVEPVGARKSGIAGIRSWERLARKWVLLGRQDPPLRPLITWELPLGAHRVEVAATGYRPWSEVVDLHDDKTIPAELRAEVGPKPYADGPGVTRTDKSRPKPSLDPTLDGRGSLSIDAYDRFARIEVFDSDARRVGSGWGELELELELGPYRVEVAMPGEPPMVESVALWDARRVHVDARPSPEATPIGLRPLLHAQFGYDGIFSRPSESFGLTVATRLGSLLAWAGMAAWAGGGHGDRLRQLGVELPLGVGRGRAYVQILIGDLLGDGADSPLNASLKIAGETVQLHDLAGAPGHARQFAIELGDAQTSVELSGPNLALRVEIPNIEDWAAIVVISREAHRGLEIHRYLARVHSGHFDDFIRRAEDNWRALERRRPLLPGEAEALLDAPGLDPLSLIVLGYRLALEGRLELFDHGSVWPRLPELADRHVLEALAVRDDPPEYRRHMAAAADAGVPLVREGYDRLLEWLSAHAAEQGLAPPIPRAASSGGAWTILDPREHAPLTAASRIIDVAELERTPWAASLARAIASPARAANAPRVGQRIAVLGSAEAFPEHVRAAQRPGFELVPAGQKVLLPGVILAIDGDTVQHDCWPMHGLDGASIVDLETGEAIGVHLGHRSGVGFGVAVPAPA